MKGDCGFAGTRTALDDQNALVLGADDGILLTLNGLDDVVHLTRTRCVQSVQESALTGDAAGFGHHACGAGRVEVQVFVVDAGDCAAPTANMASPLHALRCRGRRQIERACHRSSPVEEQRFVVVVGVQDSQSADVASLVVEVDASETHSVLGCVVLGEILGVHGVEGFAFTACLRGSAGLEEDRAQASLGILSKIVETGVQHRHVLLLELLLVQ